jgi:hypothetical protein
MSTSAGMEKTVPKFCVRNVYAYAYDICAACTWHMDMEAHFMHMAHGTWHMDMHACSRRIAGARPLARAAHAGWMSIAPEHDG